ncbi:hypothetical protein DSLASN_08280 [Desulfoluna limicola]|uniref:DUF4190 domain-containing protein n=1 Tax=Desulfoluna limicola TaxID=2810562 RepID=A0ABM7PDC0_9BACT|nr:hypothetical protein [Desulfoluna limicola]BCS95196.1 hypothetical protein DSLASN_08280 [Desulfoluna limicola]
MRTIPPKPPDDSPYPTETTRRELMFRFIIPFRLFGSAYFLGLLMGRELTEGSHLDSRGIGGRIAAIAILAVLLFVVISGVFFILYLIKSLLGVNLFSNAHLME